MIKHTCDQAPNIAVLKKTVGELEHVINGNGKKGLRDEVTLLIEETKGLRIDLNDFRTAISGMQKFMDELNGERREAERIKVFQRWVIGTLLIAITILFGAGILK